MLQAAGEFGLKDVAESQQIYALKGEVCMSINAAKDWRERVGADEPALFEQYRKIMHDIQQQQSAQFGKGRTLHRKGMLALPARVEVRDGLPEPARHGLFARPGRYEAVIRLSNGAAGIQKDSVRDVRGFAIKVLGVSGEAALGGATDCQDFLLINLPAFAFPTPDEFIGLVQAKTSGGGALLAYLLKRYGLLGALRQIKRLGRSMSRPFKGFAAAPFFSAAPFACGPYAARMRLLPAVQAAQPRMPADWAEDFAGWLGERELRFEMQLQFYVGEAQTPIEDAAVDWPEDIAPYVTVATLIVAQDSLRLRSDAAFKAKIEADSFDPWKALAAHRPLGRVMRARKVMYYDSVQNRK